MRLPAPLDRLLPAGVLLAALAPGPAALAAPGAVLDETKVSDLAGGFAGLLADGDRFGAATAPLGDLDGDGLGDLAVGAVFDDDGGSNRGAVWILFLAADGTVKSEQKISDTSGGFDGVLADDDNFGAAIAALGDLDGDMVVDIAVGAPGTAGGGAARGAIWVLFLNADGTVKSEQEIGDMAGGFGGTLADDDLFGASLALLRDVDGDGVDDLAAGAVGDGDGGELKGALWIVFLNSNGTVKAEQKISEQAGGFIGPLDFFDQFGWALCSLDDLDRDGVDDLAVGSATGINGGAIWMLFLNADGTVKSEQKIDDGSGGFAGAPGDLGWALALLGDVDGDGVRDLAAGAASGDDGGPNRGAAWILFLDTDGTVKSEQKISELAGGFEGTLADADNFGFSLAYLGSAGGAADLAIGAYRDDDNGSDRGALWNLELEQAASAVPALGGPALLALIAAIAAAGSRFAGRRRA